MAAVAAQQATGPRLGVVVFGLILIGVAALIVRARRRHMPDAPASVRLHDAAMGWVIGVLGLFAITLGLWTGQYPVVRAAVYLMMGVLPLWIAAALVGVVERRKGRQLRADLGLPVPRRRLHWGWAVGAWFSVSPGVELRGRRFEAPRAWSGRQSSGW